jgi:hypothetical protein
MFQKREVPVPVLRIRDVLSRIRTRPLLHPGSGGGKKAPDPGSDLLFYKGYNKFCLLIPDPGSGSDHCSIPDPGSGG